MEAGPLELGDHELALLFFRITTTTDAIDDEKLVSTTRALKVHLKLRLPLDGPA